MLTKAHFQVIQAARAVTSSRFTFEAKRMPPFPGPRVVLYNTRYPVNTLTSPLSSWTGTDTMTCFSGWRRMLYNPGSRCSSSAARSKRDIMASNGLSSSRNVSLSRWMTV